MNPLHLDDDDKMPLPNPPTVTHRQDPLVAVHRQEQQGGSAVDDSGNSGDGSSHGGSGGGGDKS